MTVMEAIAKGIASIAVCGVAIAITVYSPGNNSCVSAIVVIVGLAVVWNVQLIGNVTT